MKIDYNKHIWEGWSVLDFINSLNFLVKQVMNNQSYTTKILNKKDLKKFCMDNQPYYKKYIPEVVNHFAQQYNLK